MIRKIFFILFLLIVIAIACVTIFLMTFDLNSYKRLIEDKLSTLLNRPVSVESMEMKLAFIPTINIQNLTIGNPEGISSDQPFFRINQMEAVVELLPLFSSNVNIHQVSIQSAELHLIQNDKMNNWTFASTNKEESKTPAKGKTAKSNKLPSIHLDTINLDKLQLSYQDLKQSHNIELNKLILQDLHVLSGSLEYKNIPIGFNINVGRLEDFLGQKSNFPVDIEVRASRATAHLNGKIGELKDFSRMKMTFMVNIPDVSAFLKELGINSSYAPAKPLALNSVLEGNMNSLLIKQLELNVASRDSFSLTAKGKLNDILSVPTAALTCQTVLNDENLAALWKIQNFTSNFQVSATEQRIEITKLQLESNRSDLMVNASLLMQKPPKLDLIFSSNYLNIEDFLRLESNQKATDKKPSVASKQPNSDVLPWELLNKIDASIQINIKNLVVPENIKGYVRLHSVTTLDKGHAKWPFEVDVLDGTIKAMVELDATKKNINMQLQGRSLKLDNIRALSKDIQDVRLATDITLKTNGKTYSELLSQSNGQIVAELSNGYIINEWFVKLPQTLNLVQKQKTGVTYSKPDAKVPLVCGAANLDIKGGVIQSKKQLAIETDVLNFVVDGNVDLNKQMLSISMTPSINQVNNKVNAALMATQVVKISGPFTNLTPTVNPVQAVGNLLQAGARAIMGEKDTTTQAQSKALCMAALNGYQLSKANNTQKVQKKKAAPVTQKKEVKKEFKQQLLDSLSKALQTGSQGAH